MSSSFSANQYENAFKSNKLQNWTVPIHYKEKPSPAEGHTVFIATDRGHLLPGVKRGCPWPSFQGTWDLPSNIPPIRINPTARSQEGQRRLRAWGRLQHMASSTPTEMNETNENSRTQQCEGTNGDHQHEEISDSTCAPLGPELERTSQCSQNKTRPASQRSQVQSRPATSRSQVQSRPVTQQGQVQSRPATPRSQVESRPATQRSQVQSRPATQRSQDQPRPITQQGQVQSKPATQRSQVESRPITQRSNAGSQPASTQSQGKSRPLMTSQDQSRPEKKLARASIM